MKRFHIHLSVDSIEQSIGFYSRLFGAQPTVQKDDDAKWMLDEPRVNVAISARGKAACFAQRHQGQRGLVRLGQRVRKPLLLIQED
jgi:catechol 2,3-dioxygenase-like lactoylglutathione lyase family enzyme